MDEAEESVTDARAAGTHTPRMAWHGIASTKPSLRLELSCQLALSHYAKQVLIRGMACQKIGCLAIIDSYTHPSLMVS